MAKDGFPKLAGDNPNEPVTRAQVVQYVSEVIVAERRRLASILSELKGEPMEIIAEAVANPELDPFAFEWPE